MDQNNDLSELHEEISNFEPWLENNEITMLRSSFNDILREIRTRHTESDTSDQLYITINRERTPPPFEDGMTDEEYAEMLQRHEYDEAHRQEIRNIGRAIGFLNRIRRGPTTIYEDLINLGDRLGNVSKGLSKDDLDKIESKVLTEKLEQDTCPVCQEQFQVGHTKVSELICNHLYCTDCILPWLKDNKTCPICRAEQPCTNTPIPSEIVEDTRPFAFQISDTFMLTNTRYTISDDTIGTHTDLLINDDESLYDDMPELVSESSSEDSDLPDLI